jgi:tetratricopeptide (TPR) repeat protein
VAQFIGYHTQEISAGNHAVIDFRLTEETTQLDEVVVRGYASQRRQAFTGSVSTVQAEVMDDVQYELSVVEEEIAAPEAALMGRVAGVSVTESRQAKSASFSAAANRTVSVSQPEISLTPIRQDSEYMEALTKKSRLAGLTNTDDDYREYLRLREDYIGTPAFYFDMADWFFRHNDRTRALRILTSIADMELENASLFRLLGYRLKEYGAYSLEAYICRKVIAWRPMEPQSYRDYAMALSDAGRYQEALDTMHSVLTHTYAQNIGQRSSGIEEVVVTELNQLIACAKLNTQAIEKDLVQAMPVDIRIVINWNMNSTDIDLHVTDPNGETCFYNHQSTAIGGRISRDITQGYGPEQFLLRNAIKGKYKVYVNYYGDSQVKAEGPSTVMVEIYTGYGSSSQQRRVVCLQMNAGTKRTGNDLVQVAEFEF